MDQVEEMVSKYGVNLNVLIILVTLHTSHFERAPHLKTLCKKHTVHVGHITLREVGIDLLRCSNLIGELKHDDCDCRFLYRRKYPDRLLPRRPMARSA